MEPIFDKDGRTVAWLSDTNIYQLNGVHVAVLNGDNVYGHRSQQLGVFVNGLFRDNQGKVVAFISGASGGPVLPIPRIPPIPPIPSIPPIPAIPAIPRIPAIPSLSWGLDWQRFIQS